VTVVSVVASLATASTVARTSWVTRRQRGREHGCTMSYTTRNRPASRRSGRGRPAPAAAVQRACARISVRKLGESRRIRTSRTGTSPQLAGQTGDHGPLPAAVSQCCAARTLGHGLRARPESRCLIRCGVQHRRVCFGSSGTGQSQSGRQLLLKFPGPGGDEPAAPACASAPTPHQSPCHT